MHIDTQYHKCNYIVQQQRERNETQITITLYGLWHARLCYVMVCYGMVWFGLVSFLYRRSSNRFLSFHHQTVPIPELYTCTCIYYTLTKCIVVITIIIVTVYAEKERVVAKKKCFTMLLNDFFFFSLPACT